VIGNPEVKPPIICQSCRADEMGCAVKAGLSGRRCCGACGHDDLVRRGGEDLVRRDHDVVDQHDGDVVDQHDHDGVRR